MFLEVNRCILKSSIILNIIISLTGCNSGGSGNSNATTSTLPVSQYLNPTSGAPSSRVGQQFYLTTDISTTITSIRFTYYSSSDCSTPSNGVYNISGAPLNTTSGRTYVSSDQSNYALCNAWPINGVVDCPALASSPNPEAVRVTVFYGESLSKNSACVDMSGDGGVMTQSNGLACTSENCGFEAAIFLTIP